MLAAHLAGLKQRQRDVLWSLLCLYRPDPSSSAPSPPAAFSAPGSSAWWGQTERESKQHSWIAWFSFQVCLVEIAHLSPYFSYTFSYLKQHLAHSF